MVVTGRMHVTQLKVVQWKFRTSHLRPKLQKYLCCLFTLLPRVTRSIVLALAGSFSEAISETDHSLRCDRLSSLHSRSKCPGIIIIALFLTVISITREITEILE